MALQLGALRDALKAANVPDELAGRAAEELAGYESRFDRIEREMDQRFNAVDRRIDQLAADVRLLRWMVGFVLAIQVAMFVKLFVH